MELTRNLEWLMDHWDQPDEGIWETRAIHLVVGELIIPSGDGWEAAMALERAARSVIANHCGEPDMGD